MDPEFNSSNYERFYENSSIVDKSEAIDHILSYYSDDWYNDIKEQLQDYYFNKGA